MTPRKAPPAHPPPEPPAPVPELVPSYPAIESFIERASEEDVSAFLQPIRTGLSTLKGPKAVDQSKKIEKALARVEELLSHLIQVREKLDAETKSKPKGRR
jgi:hypothetical protein